MHRTGHKRGQKGRYSFFQLDVTVRKRSGEVDFIIMIYGVTRRKECEREKKKKKNINILLVSIF